MSKEAKPTRDTAPAPSLPPGIPVAFVAFPKDAPLKVRGEPLTSIRCDGGPTDTAGVESAALIPPGNVLAVRYRGETYVRAGNFDAALAKG